ncbi:MAG TPA: hypothetical protein VGB17_12210 [Pyrinomonadaceae bacterium]|jgi:hypothetical protein
MIKKIVLALLMMMMAATLAVADTIYLRDGRTIRGTVLGFVNGRFVVRIEGNTNTSGQAGSTSGNAGGVNSSTLANGDVVFIRPNQIQRIEIEGRSLDDARYITRTVRVELGPNWVDSGVDVRRGERVRISASGVIYAGRTRITPDGLRSTDPNAPLPRAAEGVLIGAIGNDSSAPITELGLNREFVADRDGRLYLTSNRSNFTDARGAFTVQVQTENALFNRNNQTAGNRNDDERSPDDYDPFGNQSRRDPAPVRSRTPQGSQIGTGTGADSRLTREKSVMVDSTLSRGTDTGIDLRAGDQITISATGNITAGRRVGVVSPEGGRVGAAAVFGASAYPVPQAGVGALIGYIRMTNGQASQPFFVGSQFNFTTQADGRLFLLVNDDNFSDNSGSFTVRITYPDTYNR